MCGINGIIGNRPNTIELVNSMNNCIIHRGPDAEGVWQSDDKKVTLGHRRLSILDLSSNGAQPMVSNSGEYVIVFNGEIYNYLKIKTELVKEHSKLNFRGTSDTELLLNLVEIYGIEKTLGMIKGMFAFVVYEKHTGNVYIARDRMGEKPLYYGKVADCVVFASDISSIEKIDFFDNKINSGVFDSYFKGGYIPAPYTIYEDIYKLEPGSFLTVNAKSREWTIKKYWDIREVALKGQANLFSGSFEEASAQLENLIKESVGNQMISDVPLGAFLSGGIDSTLVVSIMQSLSSKPVNTFTIGFEDEKYNEATFAKETAEHLGTNHTEMYVNKEDILNAIGSIPKAYTEPFADSSQIPTMLVSQMTKKHVTVSLSGDAGDEFFCGYNTYKDVQEGLRVLAGKLPFIKGGLRTGIGSFVGKHFGNSSEMAHKIASAMTVNTPESWYRVVRDTGVWKPELYKNKLQLKDSIETYQDGFLKGPEANLMLMDMLQYLPDDILVKVDRAGMLYSLESRIPLLDRDVMEFAWTLPQEYKYDGKTTKRILKDILYRYVPEKMMDRPKKGFSVPLSGWLRGNELNEWASELINNKDLMSDYLDYNIVQKMWNDFIATGNNSREIWRILMLAQWFETRK